jgi:hypothetical protein
MISGNLDRLHIGDLLNWLELGGQSGRLTVTDAACERRFDLLRGRIVYVSSTGPEERLASWIARDGLIPAKQIRELLAGAMLRHQLFTDVLLQHGAINISDLQVSLTVLAELMISRILAADKLRFEFDPDHPVRDPSGLYLNLTPSRLLLDAARRVDELKTAGEMTSSRVLPLDESEVDSFFWQLVPEGIPHDDPVDGDQLSALHNIIKNVMASLAQWLASSTGLVPQPADHGEMMATGVATSGDFRLHGLPHAAWNQMVLACSVRSSTLATPGCLDDLDRFAASLDIWPEITTSQKWQRGRAGKLDRLTRRVSVVWSRCAAAAADVLDVDPGATELAAHLVTVPTDLVLWVLGALPVPHQGIRRAVLTELPRRIGAGLGVLADFPPRFRRLLDVKTTTGLGVCLHLSRGLLPSSAVWPRTVPEGEAALLDLYSADQLQAAALAAREASEGIDTEPAANA